MSNIFLSRQYTEELINDFKGMYNIAFKPVNMISIPEIVVLTDLTRARFLLNRWEIENSFIILNSVCTSFIDTIPHLVLQPSLSIIMRDPPTHRIAIPHSPELLMTITSKTPTIAPDEEPIESILSEEIPETLTIATGQPITLSEPQNTPDNSLHVRDGDIMSAAKYNNLVNQTLKNSEDIQFILKKLNPNNNSITSLQLEEPK